MNDSTIFKIITDDGEKLAIELNHTEYIDTSAVSVYLTNDAKLYLGHNNDCCDMVFICTLDDINKSLMYGALFDVNSAIDSLKVACNTLKDYHLQPADYVPGMPRIRPRRRDCEPDYNNNK